MSVVLITPESKKIVVNLSADECLYEAPREASSADPTCSFGVDLYAHKAKSGTIYFYTYAWSTKDGGIPEFALIPEYSARDFLIERTGFAGDAYLNEKLNEKFEEFFPGIMDEDG